MSNDNKCMTCMYDGDTATCAKCTGFSEYLQREEPTAQDPLAVPAWKTWEGGERPVPHDVYVDFRLRSGTVFHGRAAWALRWSHEGNADDIVEYCIVQPEGNQSRTMNYGGFSKLAEQCVEPFKSVKEKVKRCAQGAGRFHKGGFVNVLPAPPSSFETQYDMNLDKKIAAPKLLNEAAEIMEERGRQYDQPNGERSMAKTVAAFNIITGHQLSEADGWEFMKVLKQVRLFSVRGKTHEDSVKDEIAYSALLGECIIRRGTID